MRVGVPSSQPEFCGRDHLHGRRASAAADVVSALFLSAVVVFFAANPVSAAVTSAAVIRLHKALVLFLSFL